MLLSLSRHAASVARAVGVAAYRRPQANVYYYRNKDVSFMPAVGLSPELLMGVQPDVCVIEPGRNTAYKTANVYVWVNDDPPVDVGRPGNRDQVSLSTPLHTIPARGEQFVLTEKNFGEIGFLWRFNIIMECHEQKGTTLVQVLAQIHVLQYISLW